MGSSAFRYSLPILFLALSGQVGAVGLGEMRGQSVLGQGLHLEISLLGAEQLAIDTSCFRLVQPADGGELPWLKKARLAYRKGKPPVLEIRSAEPLREPLLQLAVQLGCGYEISREYVLMASPAMASVPSSVPPLGSPRSAGGEAATAKRLARVRSAEPRLPAERAPIRSRAVSKPKSEAMLPDRLVLAEGDAGEPSLRLATTLVSAKLDATEAQREIFRLEYRMLMALHDQATSQLATAEKLRSMEGALAELQERAAQVAERVEQVGTSPGPQTGPMPLAVQPAAESPGQTAPQTSSVAAAVSPAETSAPYSDWGLYGILLGAALGLAGWLVWRNHGVRQRMSADAAPTICEPDIKVDPPRRDEHPEPGGVDLPFEPAAMGMPMRVDLELDARDDSGSVASTTPGSVADKAMDSVLSINATTLDEQFEANPVMELADIMLSFGRVKGAAQALQEYIDSNPQEALHPWIRLMDVYRLAGMRDEFEKVARNLNQHFNVEVQNWDEGKPGMEPPSSRAPGTPVAPRPQSLEDLPRLMCTVVELWNTGDVVGYLYQLLRDNRGGQRLGFALPVVEDILFLVELKETANRMESVQ